MSQDEHDDRWALLWWALTLLFLSGWVLRLAVEA
jgi:hypothetical protein